MSLFIVLVIPIDVDGYDDYKICYHYDVRKMKEFETHYPHYEKYSIQYKDELTSSNYHFELFLEKNKLLFKNVITNDSVSFNYNDVFDFEIIENKESYLIFIHDFNVESVIYYVSINKKSISNEKSFLDYVKNSFSRYDVPELAQIGYLTMNGSEYLYPFLFADFNEKFYIDENGHLYVIKVD